MNTLNRWPWLSRASVHFFSPKPRCPLQSFKRAIDDFTAITSWSSPLHTPAAHSSMRGMDQGPLSFTEKLTHPFRVRKDPHAALGSSRLLGGRERIVWLSPDAKMGPELHYSFVYACKPVWGALSRFPSTRVMQGAEIDRLGWRIRNHVGPHPAIIRSFSCSDCAT